MTTTEYIADTIPLPSVRICPKYHGTRSSTQQVLTEMHWFYTEGSDTVYERTEGNPLIFETLGRARILANVPKQQFFHMCTWQKELVNCSELTEYSVYEIRPCFYFHSQAIQEKYGQLKLKGTGVDLGFTMLIDTHEHEAIFIPTYDPVFGTGIQINLLDPGSQTGGDGWQLAPGMAHNIDMSYVKRTRLSRPYTDDECVSRDDDPDYDFKRCQLDVLTHLRTADCTCYDRGNDTCLYVDYFNCLRSHQQVLDDFKREAAKCKRNCETVEYEAHITSSNFPSPSTYAEIEGYVGLNRTYEEYKEGVMVVNLFVNSMVCRETKQHAAFTVTSLLANMGGLIGLFVGASLITVCEFLEIVVVSLGNMCTKCFKGLKETSLGIISSKPTVEPSTKNEPH